MLRGSNTESRCLPAIHTLLCCVVAGRVVSVRAVDFCGQQVDVEAGNRRSSIAEDL